MDNVKVHLTALMQLAISDQSLHPKEKTTIYKIGKAHGMAETEIEVLLKEVLSTKENKELTFPTLSFERRVEYLVDLVQLMKIDNEVYLGEIKYCEKIAGKLGFDKKIVKVLSSRIYSDPDIASDKDMLMKIAKDLEI